MLLTHSDVIAFFCLVLVLGGGTSPVYSSEAASAGAASKDTWRLPSQSHVDTIDAGEAAPLLPDSLKERQEDSTETSNAAVDRNWPAHEVGVVASAFFKLFEEAQESYALNYRYRYAQHHSLRAGVSYEYDSKGSGTFDLSARLGYDRVFPLDDRWAVYVGGDFIGTHLRFDSGSRQTTLLGVAPLIGASVRIGSRLYISSEPRLFIRRGWQQTDNSVSERWWEMKLVGIGELIINVRF